SPPTQSGDPRTIRMPTTISRSGYPQRIKPPPTSNNSSATGGTHRPVNEAENLASATPTPLAAGPGTGAPGRAASTASATMPGDLLPTGLPTTTSRRRNAQRIKPPRTSNNSRATGRTHRPANEAENLASATSTPLAAGPGTGVPGRSASAASATMPGDPRSPRI